MPLQRSMNLKKDRSRKNSAHQNLYHDNAKGGEVFIEMFRTRKCVLAYMLLLHAARPVSRPAVRPVPHFVNGLHSTSAPDLEFHIFVKLLFAVRIWL